MESPSLEVFKQWVNVALRDGVQGERGGGDGLVIGFDHLRWIFS